MIPQEFSLLPPIDQRLATELNCNNKQVCAAIDLLDDGASVPFIARYRKEATGGLDDTQLRTLEKRLGYLRELEDRREAVINSVREQDKLDDALLEKLQLAATKTELEDLYLPYKPRRVTRAQKAIEAGLEPLAEQLLQNQHTDPLALAQKFSEPGSAYDTADKALEGARQIILERIAQTPELVRSLRELCWSTGIVTAKVVEGKEDSGSKYKDYFDHSESAQKIASHRILALFRARNEGVVHLDLEVPFDSEQDAMESHPAVRRIRAHFGFDEQATVGGAWLVKLAVMAWRAKIHLHLTMDIFNTLREQAEEQAIGVFADNLKDMLLAAPAGTKATIGLDPGLRTGVKVAVVDATGKLVDTATIYPHAPKKQWDSAKAELTRLIQKHDVKLIAIGNGTASRETEKLAGELLAGGNHKGFQKVLVSEAGASVYSASEAAAKEFPKLDVSLRGAVSIARRLQDPLAELVKIEPKSIGVGQYQHDVNQIKLGASLDVCVEDCVNRVGVELNTASAPLLARVSGLNSTLAENIVSYRDEHGPFASRAALLAVPRLGPKAFEQAAGFLRIKDGSNPLDASAVHPESYAVVKAMLDKLGLPCAEAMGKRQVLRELDPQAFTSATVGLPTVQDILIELEKPGRDPRGEFITVEFADGIEKPTDLRVGMRLQGQVSNVTNFGAFVDVGVHQDGLVHISQLSNQFVKDPRSIVKAGDIVTVWVIELDLARNRIALSMRGPQSEDQTTPSAPARSHKAKQPKQKKSARKPAAGTAGEGALAAAFRKAGRK